MKKMKFIACLAFMPLMLAACGGESASSSSISSSQDTSSESLIHSTHIQSNVHVSVGVHMYGNALVEQEAGVSYTNASNLQRLFIINITKNESSEDLVVESNHIVMPAGSKFTVSCAQSTDHFYASATSEDGTTYNTNLEFVDAVDPANLGLEGATGTASGVAVNLAFASEVTTFSFVPTVEVKLSKITLCYGYNS